MPERPRPRPSRSSAPRGGRAALRERLKRDPFLFMLCLAALAFMTWAFALTWWVTGGGRARRAGGPVHRARDRPDLLQGRAVVPTA